MATKIQLTRRTLLAATSAALTTPGIVRANTGFPDQPIRLIVPWSAGGATDMVLRVIGEAVAKNLGQPVITDNRPGASGTMGASYLAGQARPDGYTLSQMPTTVLRMPYMSNSVSFDPLKDFTWVSQLTGYTFGIAVRADSPFKKLQDLFDWAKANPGKLTYGTSGVGTSIHLTMEQIALDRGLDLLHVPFRGVADDMVALMGGSVMASADSSGWAPLVADGKLRLLCVWTAERLKQFPDVPTLRECGIDMVVTSAFGVAGPKDMDPAVVNKLDTAFEVALKDPSVLAIFERLDQVPAYLNNAAYTAAVQHAITSERPLLQRLNLLIQR